MHTHFKMTNSEETKTLIGFHLAMGVMKMPRVYLVHSQDEQSRMGDSTVGWMLVFWMLIFFKTPDRFFQLPARHICIWSTVWRIHLRIIMCFSRYSMYSMMPYTVDAWSFHQRRTLHLRTNGAISYNSLCQATHRQTASIGGENMLLMWEKWHGLQLSAALSQPHSPSSFLSL